MQCKVYTLSIPPSSCDSHFGRRFAASTTIYGRYKFVQKLAQLMRVTCPRLNTAALVIGMLSCFGMCVVATFQVSVHACWLWNTQSLKNTLNAFAYFHLLLVHFRKQQWQMFIELEPCSSLYLGFFIWSSNVLYRAILLRMERPLLFAECV